MKIRSFVVLLAVLTLPLLLGSGAHAQVFGTTAGGPVNAGSSTTFSGTLSNDGLVFGGDPAFIDSAAVTGLPPTFAVDTSNFVANFIPANPNGDQRLFPGAGLSPTATFNMFTVSVPSGTAPGLYPGTLSIFGYDPDGSGPPDILIGTIPFTLQVLAPLGSGAGEAPEGAGWLLMLAALLPAAGLFYRPGASHDPPPQRRE